MLCVGFVQRVNSNCSSVCVLQGVVKDLFSQFGSVESVDLRDHPGSFQESGPRLSRFFRPAEKQVDLCCCAGFSLFTAYFRSCFTLCVSICLRVSKLATLYFKTPPVYRLLNHTHTMCLWWSAQSSVRSKQEYRVSRLLLKR